MHNFKTALPTRRLWTLE